MKQYPLQIALCATVLATMLIYIVFAWPRTDKPDHADSAPTEVSDIDSSAMLPAPNVTTTHAQDTLESTQAASAAPVGKASLTYSGTLNDYAQHYIDRLSREFFFLAPDGNWIIRREGYLADVDLEHGRDELIEYRNVDFTYLPLSTSRADKANGVQGRLRVIVTYELMRHGWFKDKYAEAGWKEWSDPTELGTIAYSGNAVLADFTLSVRDNHQVQLDNYRVVLAPFSEGYRQSGFVTESVWDYSKPNDELSVFKVGHNEKNMYRGYRPKSVSGDIRGPDWRDEMIGHFSDDNHEYQVTLEGETAKYIFDMFHLVDAPKQALSTTGLDFELILELHAHELREQHTAAIEIRIAGIKSIPSVIDNLSANFNATKPEYWIAPSRIPRSDELEELKRNHVALTEDFILGPAQATVQADNESLFHTLTYRWEISGSRLLALRQWIDDAREAGYQVQLVEPSGREILLTLQYDYTSPCWDPSNNTFKERTGPSEYLNPYRLRYVNSVARIIAERE